MSFPGPFLNLVQARDSIEFVIFKITFYIPCPEFGQSIMFIKKLNLFVGVAVCSFGSTIHLFVFNPSTIQLNAKRDPYYLVLFILLAWGTKSVKSAILIGFPVSILFRAPIPISMDMIPSLIPADLA